MRKAASCFAFCLCLVSVGFLAVAMLLAPWGLVAPANALFTAMWSAVLSFVAAVVLE